MQNLECPNLLETNTPETQRQGGVQKGRFYLSKGWSKLLILGMFPRSKSPFQGVVGSGTRGFDSFLEG